MENKRFRNGFCYKGGQISIFLIIALVLIIGFTWIVSGDAEQKIKDPILVKETVKSVSLPTDFLKRNVDMCLKTRLKRATVMAGLRGGFVFNRDGLRENYLKNHLDLAKYYNEEYLVKYQSNVEYSNQVLIWDNIKTSIPKINYTYYELNDNYEINYSAPQFNHTIKEDFENYILIGLQDCLIDGFNSENAEGVYKLNYSKYVIL